MTIRPFFYMNLPAGRVPKGSFAFESTLYRNGAKWEHGANADIILTILGIGIVRYFVRDERGHFVLNLGKDAAKRRWALGFFTLVPVQHA